MLYVLYLIDQLLNLIWFAWFIMGLNWIFQAHTTSHCVSFFFFLVTVSLCSRSTYVNRSKRTAPYYLFIQNVHGNHHRANVDYERFILLLLLFVYGSLAEILPLLLHSQPKGSKGQFAIHTHHQVFTSSVLLKYSFLGCLERRHQLITIKEVQRTRSGLCQLRRTLVCSFHVLASSAVALVEEWFLNSPCKTNTAVESVWATTKKEKT